MRRMLLGPLQMAALGSLLLALLLVVPAFGQCPSHEGAGAGNAGTAESAGTEGTKEAAAVPAQAEPGDAQAPADETKAEVPELIALHEVIYPLWHEAWPSKNAAMIKELLPQVEAHVQAIRTAELPGILRDKKPAWDAAVASLEQDVATYRTAAAGSEVQPMLDAVEALHSRFESMVRIVRPVMKELDAYHVVLYGIYHKEMPEKRLDDLSVSAKALVERCGALVEAPIPARFAAKEPELKAGFASLCEATAELRVAASGAGADAAAVEAAVEKVHTRYQAVVAIFES